MGESNAMGGGADAPPSLVVDVVTQGGEVRVLVEGDLDGITRLRVHEAVWAATAEAAGAGRFVLDLRGVTTADVAGVQGLVELWRLGIVDRFEHVSDAVAAVVGKEPGAPFAG